MPHPKAEYLPGDNPPDLTGQVDRRIRSALDGSHLPVAQDLAALLVAALRAEVPAHPPAHPAALADDTQVFQEGARSLLGSPGQLNVGVQLLGSNLQAHTMVAIDPHDPIYGTYTALQVQGLLEPFLNRLARQVVDAWYTQSALRIRPSADVLGLFYRFDTMASLDNTNDQATLGAAYLAAYPQSAGFQAVLVPKTKQALAESLGRIPAVKTALEGAGSVPLRGGVAARWSTDPLVEPAPSDLDSEETSLVTEKALPSTVKNVKAALHALSNIIAPGVHQQLPTPRFTVVKTAGTDLNVRASTEAGGITITIGETDGPDVVAHEVGHVLENTLPLGCWLDLVRLLHGRHAAAGGGTLLPLHPRSQDTKLAKECSYRAEMPAYPAGATDRGSYAARVYGGDSPTEVMSTALEMLVTPSGTKTLLTQDPQVLAIVLRWLLGRDGVDRGSGQLLAWALPS